jgi:hypothetical protein
MELCALCHIVPVRACKMFVFALLCILLVCCMLCIEVCLEGTTRLSIPPAMLSESLQPPSEKRIRSNDWPQVEAVQLALAWRWHLSLDIDSVRHLFCKTLHWFITKQVVCMFSERRMPPHEIICKLSCPTRECLARSTEALLSLNRRCRSCLLPH